MTNKKLFLLLLIFLISVIYIIYFIKGTNTKGTNTKENFTKQNKLCIIVTTYNPGIGYIDKCLKSIEKQTYKNYEVCIIDDASNKNVKELHKLIYKYCNRNNWNFYIRIKNIGPLGARINAIDKLHPNDEDIIVSIDGDDELYDENVFTKLNKTYQDDTLITFGNYIDSNTSKKKINCKVHNFKKLIRKNNFRKYRWIFTHLKTFKYKLYKEIDHKDLKYNNKYFKSATDFALMFPMLEMCGGKLKCIQHNLYIYNRTHPESNNENKDKLSEQKINAKIIRRLKPYENKFK